MQAKSVDIAGTHRRCFVGAALGIVAMLVLAGCSGGPVQVAGDEADALTWLSAALDAWQAGQKPDELRNEQPAVYVADHDWQSGQALKAYQVIGAPEEVGGHWRVSAQLTLVVDGRSEIQKSVAYAVTVEPAITVLRADDTINE